MSNMNESKIIMALNEAKKKKVIKEDADGDYTYKCPECGYVFNTNEEIDDKDSCKCPECGTKITPECFVSDKSESKKKSPRKKNESDDPQIDDTTPTDDKKDTKTESNKKLVKHKKTVVRAKESDDDDLVDDDDDTKTSDEGFTPAGDVDGNVSNGGMNILYKCPDCDAVFYIDASDFGEDDSEVICPECGKAVTPVPVGSLYDTEDATEAFVPAVKKVVGGKLVKIKAHTKKKITGSRLAKLLKNLKKARKFSHKGTANAKRKRSMKKRSSLLSSYNIDENVVIEMLNNVITDVMESYDEYVGFDITKINESIYDEESDILGLDCSIKYEDGNSDTAIFTIEGLDTEDKAIVREHTGVLDINSLEMYSEGAISDDGNIVISEMSYFFRHNGKSFEESFVIK